MKMDTYLTLAQLKEKYQGIADSWNGEDKTFTSGGETYTEDQATSAKDIVDILESAENMIKNFNF